MGPWRGGERGASRCSEGRGMLFRGKAFTSTEFPPLQHPGPARSPLPAGIAGPPCRRASVRGAIFPSFAALCGARRETDGDVFCPSRAGLAGRSMIEEDWNAEIGDEALLPSRENVLSGGRGGQVWQWRMFPFPFLSSNSCPCNLSGCWAEVSPVLVVFGNMVGSRRSSLLLKRGGFVCTTNLFAAVLFRY